MAINRSLPYAEKAICNSPFPKSLYTQPYKGAEVDVFDGEYGPKYRALKDSINESGAKFAIHTGDVKAGGASCGASSYKRFRDLAEFDIPSLLTLGGQ